MAKKLELHQQYSRSDVHEIFSPDTVFTPQAGTWGLHGIVEVPDRKGDYIFFVSFGQSQGAHDFGEFITEDGVLSWQSQPRQGLNDRRIKDFFIMMNSATTSTSSYGLIYDPSTPTLDA